MNNTKKLAVCGIFGALATILYVVPFFKFPLPILFPSFLEFNFSDIPTLIAGFTYGPVVAFFVHLVKILIKLPFTSTMGVGECADLINGLAFVLPASFIYKQNKNKRHSSCSIFSWRIFYHFPCSFLHEKRYKNRL